MEDYEKIELRSEEFREILGTPPRWIVQYGTTVAVIGFFIVALFSYFFTYPDVVKAPIKVSTADPPVSILAREYGYLDNLVAEHSMVQQGDLLAVLREDSGDPDDILRLDEIVEDLAKFDEEFTDFEPDKDLKLGSIQATYSAFVQLHKQHNFTRVSQFESEEITRADNEIMDIEAEIEDLLEQINEVGEQIKEYEGPLKEKYKEVYAKTKSAEAYKVLQDRPQKIKEFWREIKDLRAKIGEREREIGELNAKKLGIREGWEVSKSSRGNNLKLQLYELRDAITQWKEEHLILAPISGKVYYTDLLKSGEERAKKDGRIMAIVPTDAEKNIQGKMYISPAESGKVRIDQPVNIRFQAYPVSDYGLLGGIVSEKAAIANEEDGTKLIKINIDQLVTSTGKVIPFEHDMQGYAHIITEDRPLLFRFFDYFAQEE